jgi:1-acyl-sn-glycerol-3-phosphate acyltransferase
MGAIRVVRNGGAVLIFPEGTRSPDGNLQPAQPGIGMIVAKTGAPVVPIKISGSYDAFPRGSSCPRLWPVTVSVGPALRFESLETDCRDFYQKASDRILDAVARI